MGWLLSLVAFLFKLFRGAPDPKVVEGEKLGAVTQAAMQSENTNVEVAKADTARNAVMARAVADPGGLRDPDPHSRD